MRATTLHVRPPRNWHKLLWVQLRAYCCTVTAFLATLLTLFGIASLTNRLWSGSGSYVWWFAGAAACGLIAYTTFGKALPCRTMDLSESDHRSNDLWKRLIKLITHASPSRTRILTSEHGQFFGIMSLGLPLFPTTLVIQGVGTHYYTAKEHISGIAHEYGHLYRGNIFIISLIRFIGSVLMMTGLFLGHLTPHSNYVSRTYPAWHIPFTVFSYLGYVIILPLAMMSFYAGLAWCGCLYWLPYRLEEYAADSMAFAVMGTSKHMIQLLEKMEDMVVQHNTVPPGTERLVSPIPLRSFNLFFLLSPEGKNARHNLLAWHPSNSNRIRALRWLES